MKTQPAECCDGFSLVELLVTIVLAGVVFAAMIPFFSNAQSANSDDQLRLITMDVAQDKIEKIRQLPYDAIVALTNADGTPDTTTGSSVSNLNSAAFADGQFGTVVQISTGQATRNLKIAYGVTSYPLGSTGLASQYKIVSVTASWTAPPSPVKVATLKTIVYRQYSGPPISNFSTTPGIGDDGVVGDVTLASVTLRAQIDLTSGATIASAHFEISLLGGQTLAAQSVRVTDTNLTAGYWYDPSTKSFYWTWDCSLAVNGTYHFSVTAVSSDGFAGATCDLYPAINHKTPPAAPSNLIASPYNSRVDLTWNASGAGDLAGYAVYRGGSASGPWTQLATVAKTALSYSDATAVNQTTYYYAVRALATTGLYSAYAVSNSTTSAAPSDTTPPTAPTITSVAKIAGAPTLTITWTASTDPGTPSTGISKYEIYRSADNVAWTSTPLYTLLLPANGPPYIYNDATAGYASSWWYRIRAFDGYGGAGAGAGPSSVAVRGGPTDALPRHNLVISIAKGNNGSLNVWVINTSSGHYWTTANPAVDNGTRYPAPASLPKNGSVTFYALPDGPYNVYVNSGAFNERTNKSYGPSSTVGPADGALSGVVFP